MLYYPFMLVFLGSHLPGPEIDGPGDAPGAEGSRDVRAYIISRLHKRQTSDIHKTD